MEALQGATKPILHSSRGQRKVVLTKIKILKGAKDIFSSLLSFKWEMTEGNLFIKKCTR